MTDQSDDCGPQCPNCQCRQPKRPSRTRPILTAVLLVFVAASVITLVVKEVGRRAAAEPVTAEPVAAEPVAAEPPPPAVIDHQTVVYYFHGTKRCSACRKLEASTEQAVRRHFAESLADGSLAWRPVNTDLPENAHFLKRYQLFTKAVILSEVHAGDEVRHHNLDRIWELVDDAPAFESYIEGETRAFLAGET